MASWSPPSAEASPPDTVAAVDLGSNSFHMIVARISDGDLQVIDRLKEMVRLGEGLPDERQLLPAVVDRALACLERFGQRLRGMPPDSVRVVGTNTLRQLDPTFGFRERAEQALGHAINVIAGREEARLIYLGVANGPAAGDERRLVVDIGGGSTELIVGEGVTQRLRESLHMGCVSMSREGFPGGKLSAKHMDQTELTGALEIRPVREQFRCADWKQAVGSSGTIRAIATVVEVQGWSTDGISAGGPGSAAGRTDRIRQLRCHRSQGSVRTAQAGVRRRRGRAARPVHDPGYRAHANLAGGPARGPHPRDDGADPA